jgi:hypothetical protein
MNDLSNQANSSSHSRKLLIWRINAALRILKQDGPRRLLKVLHHRWVVPRIEGFARDRYRRQLSSILVDQPARPFVIVSTVDWNFPFHQRPQHIASALGHLGRACFYVTPRSGYDSFYGFEALPSGVVVTDQQELLWSTLVHPVVITLSTDNRIGMSFLGRASEKGWQLVYDYIDAIDPAISMTEIPADRIAAHDHMLRDEQVCCVASARSLHEEVAAKRTRNFALITNGVDVEHFRVERRLDRVSADFRRVVEAGKPIVGYYGALASWFDFALATDLARGRADLSIVLIGPDYDGSAKRWLASLAADGGKPPNLHVLPAVTYAELPAYAAWFDVATIPFLINDVTLATSPLKLFEYMALGCAIVSTPLPECRMYRSVLIGERGQPFLDRVDEALKLRSDPAYRDLLRREAEENSWTSKARDLIALVEGRGTEQAALAPTAGTRQAS